MASPETNTSAVTAFFPFVEVAVDIPVRTLFTYRIPEGLRGRVQPGHRLWVPFRGRPRTALAVELRHDLKGGSAEHLGESKLATVLDVLDPQPTLPAALVQLLVWISRYYFAPPGEVLRLMLPRPMRERGRRSVSATEFGNQCLRRNLISDPLIQKTLNYLNDAPRAVNDSRLRKAVRGLTLVRLNELAHKGLVKIQLSQANATRGRIVLTYLRHLADPQPGRRIGKKQAGVLRVLEGRGWVELKEVRELTEASRATVRNIIKRGWIEERRREAYRDPFADEPIPAPKTIQLTGEQQAAVTRIVAGGNFDRFRSFLLHGVTGSGKTEVYLAAISAAVDAGKRALVLLPEIALTPQLVAIFRSRFGHDVAALHSGLNVGQRFDEWRRIQRGEVRVVIGARSAIFAPISSLGVIVVDEEHDSSFKQDTSVRYNARDLALVRGQFESATVILGSATPSLETLKRSMAASERLLLTSRPTGQRLPRVEVVDMRGAVRHKGKKPLISDELSLAIKEVVAKGQQAILFLNRRGHSPSVICEQCGFDWQCPHCEVTLTYHRRADALRCHYCDYKQAMPDICPSCRHQEWVFLGAGTEKLSDQLARELEGLRVARLDRDSTSGGKTREIIEGFRSHDSDVLVGTQMVTKGHDFPRVTLVGVVMADLSLRIPDFRSGERTFQLLAQVAGRAGRGDEPGRVLVQTYLPDHPVVQAAVNHDYDRFAREELMSRRALSYPPYGFLVAIRFEGLDLERVIDLARTYAVAANHAASTVGSADVSILGPVESPLGKLKDRHRWQMLVRGKTRSLVRRTTAAILDQAGFGGEEEGMWVLVDVDPINLM